MNKYRVYRQVKVSKNIILEKGDIVKILQESGKGKRILPLPEIKKIVLSSKNKIRDMLYSNIEKLNQENNRIFGLELLVELNKITGKLELNILAPYEGREGDAYYLTLLIIPCSYNYKEDSLLLGNKYAEYTVDILKLTNLLKKAHIDIEDINYDKIKNKEQAKFNYYNNKHIFTIKEWFNYVVYPMDKFSYNDAINEVNISVVDKILNNFNPGDVFKKV